MGHRLTRLDDPVLMAKSKPMVRLPFIIDLRVVKVAAEGDRRRMFFPTEGP